MSNINFLLKRSNTASKRPTAASLDVGELGLNYDGVDPGLFFEDDDGNIRKVGPTTVSATAPNSTPATGGSTGNSVGECWLDTSVTPNVLKVWDGSAWVSTSGGTPGGNTTEVQFNNAGAFDGNANFTFNDADEILSVTTFEGDLDGAVVFTAEASVNISKGEAVYIDGIQGNVPTVALAQANSASTMPAFGIADVDITAGSTGHIVSFGQIGNLDTDTPGFAVGDTLFVSAATAGEITNSAPTGETSLIQNVGRVERVSTTVGRIVVVGAGRTNATPNLNDGNIFVGNASNQSVADAFTDVLNAQAGIDSSADATAITIGADETVTFAQNMTLQGADLTAEAELDVKVIDNSGLALRVMEGTNEYMRFTTTDGSERIQTTKELEVNGLLNVGGGVDLADQTSINIVDNSGFAFRVMEGTNEYVRFTTTDGAELIDFSKSVKLDGGVDIAGPVAYSGDIDCTIDAASSNALDFVIDGGNRMMRFNTNTETVLLEQNLEVDGTAKFDGVVDINSTSTFADNLTIENAKAIRYSETTGNGSNFIAFRAPNAVTADTTFVLPDGDGSAGQFLSTNGSATLAWASAGAAALTNGNIFVGGAGGSAADVAMSGDITIDNTGATTIKNDVALAGNPTTSTQTAGTGNTTIATTAYADAAAAAATPSLTDSEIFVGNGSNVATSVALSGDATITNLGALSLIDDVALGGNPTTTTQSAGTNDTTIATTGYADAAVAAVSSTYVDVAGDTMTGNLQLANQSDLRFGDADNSNFVAFQAPATVAADLTWTLPNADGSASQTLVTDGAGNLSWANAGAGQKGEKGQDGVKGQKGEVGQKGQDGSKGQKGQTGSITSLTDSNILVGDATNAPVGVAMSGDVTIDNTGAATIAANAVTSAKILDDTIVNADINSAAAIDFSKLATLTDGNLLVGNGSNVATSVAMSGDITIDNAGATTIKDDVALGGSPTTTTPTILDISTKIATTAFVATSVTANRILADSEVFVGSVGNIATARALSGDATITNAGVLTIAADAITTAKIADSQVNSAKILDDTIVNADINSAAAIDYSKLAALTSASLLVGDASNVPTVTAVSGDVTLSNTGVVDIIDDVALGGNPTTTTQADTDNSTRIATTSFVQTRVDTAIQGLSAKQSTAAASTANLTLSGTQTVDGIALSAGDRILVKDQTSAAENGIYDVAAGAWARSSDADTWDELVGAFVFVEAGTSNGNNGYTTTTVTGGTLGTTDIDWIQFSSAGQVTAGAGMTKTGSELNVITADASRIVVNSDDIDLATTGVAAGTYTSLTVDTYGRATSGTNPTTFAGYSISDTSANLAAAITDETGTGVLVFATDPALAGTPTAPTAAAGTSTTQIATTAYADAAVGAISGTYVDVAGDTMTGVLNMGASVTASADSTHDIGTDAVRFANVYADNLHSGDLHLTNDRGSYTMIEEEDALTLRNNKTGKVYNIMMQERV